MLFTDPLFLFYFLPFALLAVRLCTLRGRILFFLKISIILVTFMFYAYENWLWVVLFLVIVSGPYLYGLFMRQSTSECNRRILLYLSVGHSLFFLCVFKYFSWLSLYIPVFRPISGVIIHWFGHDGQIILPPGISFYVFEAISYSVDLYRGVVVPPRNPLDYLTFIAMFPRFIAGPIVRFADLEAQIRNWKNMNFAQGLPLFALGFCMKCLLADQFSVFVSYAFNVGDPDFVQAWTGVASYSLQLYYDFWGYSIMATGLGLCLGFQFPDNFRSPYHATSITQFWKHWHISLSSWLRDYLYIPFGGNRKGTVRTYCNLLATMLLGGIWHGANFTFAIWGFFHGVCLSAERAIGEARLSRIPVVFRHGITMLLIAIGWTLFRSDNFNQASRVYAGMLGLNGFAPQFNPMLIVKNSFSAGLACLGLIFCAFGEKGLVRDTSIATRCFNAPTQAALLALFFVALLVSSSSAEIPFLYFKF